MYYIAENCVTSDEILFIFRVWCFEIYKENAIQKVFCSLFLHKRKNFLNLNREIRAIFSICALHDSNSSDGGGDGGFVFVYALLPLLLKNTKPIFKGIS